MDYHSLLASVRGKIDPALITQYGEQVHANERYPLVRIDVPGEPLLLVTAGIHGYEVAGPLCIERHIAEFVKRAQDEGIGLRIYPCLNPSGFQNGTRYNADNEVNNNDFVRYLVSGLWRDDPEEKRFTEWKMTDTPVPQETRALHSDLEGIVPAALVDLHQDLFHDENATYAYVFGDRTRFVPIMEKISRRVPLATHLRIGGGHGTRVDESGQIIADDSRNDTWAPKTDEHGLIERHDGTLNCYFALKGVPFSVTVETFGAVPIEDAIWVNEQWVWAGFEEALRARRG